MFKKIALPFLFLYLSATWLFGQQAAEENSPVKWMSLQEAMEKNKTVPKPLLIDFYTDWCGWCKQMMRTTYSNTDLAQYINTNFYPVKFNAETKDTLEYLGNKYGPTSAGRNATNELAVKMLQGKLVYPTTLFLNSFDKQKNDFVFTMTAQGYLETQKIEPILIFTLENAFRNSGYEDFKNQYDTAFYSTSTEAKLKNVKWLSPAEAFNGKETSKKKTIVLIHTDWCNSCKVMYRTSFLDTLLYDSVKEKFNLVDFNPEIRDTINFKGQTYVNPRTQQMPFHQLAFALCHNSFTLPGFVVLDEQLNVIDVIPYYLGPDILKNITTYYGDNIYKTKSWNDFMAEVNKK